MTNRNDIEQAKDRDLAGSIHALRRAAKRARQIAAQTGTALIIMRGGRIERVIVTDQEALPKKPAG